MGFELRFDRVGCMDAHPHISRQTCMALFQSLNGAKSSDQDQYTKTKTEQIRKRNIRVGERDFGISGLFYYVRATGRRTEYRTTFDMSVSTGGPM